MSCADDALKSMECENNLSMFKAIAHLQVSQYEEKVLGYLLVF